MPTIHELHDKVARELIEATHVRFLVDFGLGSAIPMMAALKSTPGRVLVVTTPALFRMYREEAKRAGVDTDRFTFVSVQKLIKMRPEEYDLIIVNQVTLGPVSAAALQSFTRMAKRVWVRPLRERDAMWFRNYRIVSLRAKDIS